MRKSLKLLFGILLTMLFISCGSSDESVVEKYLPGTYTRDNRKEGKIDNKSYFKELKIEHLKGNEYRVTCVEKDKHYSNGEIEVLTPDIYDFEISSIKLEQKSDSISEYSIEGFVTNIIENGTTISYANRDVNYSGGMTLIIGKDTVETLIWGKTLSSVRKK